MEQHIQRGMKVQREAEEGPAIILINLPSSSPRKKSKKSKESKRRRSAKQKKLARKRACAKKQG